MGGCGLNHVLLVLGINQTGRPPTPLMEGLAAWVAFSRPGVRVLLRTPTILTTLKTSTMEKKFIQKCNLGDILEALAESALRNIDKVNVEISFQEVCNSKMLVVVVRDVNDFSKLSCGEYVIVENNMDEGDILDETVSDALAKREELQYKEINNQ